MSLPSLPLFHRLAGQPVVVLGHGEAAEAKRRLVLRAGGKVIEDLAEGIDIGARLAFIAHEDEAACQADAIRARGAGLLVNVVDKPALCDFTTPSIIDRAPVLIAVGTGGASAGLAKALRLRLERLLPQGLGALAEALYAAREAMRARWPTGPERRRALDAALEEGGALDPLRSGDAAAVEAWLAGGADGMDLVRRIVAGAKDRLSNNGVLIVEIGNEYAHAEAAFSDRELTWLTTSAGDEAVFLLTADQL
jgi:uroporphyrin-III C-methyltransferase/precorrin-2 dehydrogenase/sirohydrochlorin ferrochelatase